MGHDLIAFPGARISLTAIDGIVNEMEDGKPTGVVTINYGRHSLSFEGSEADVMEIIDAYCGLAASG
jgi:hypothetical protein